MSNRRILQVERYDSDEYGTYGSMWIDDFECYTLELQWKDNVPNISCIPVGVYHAETDKNVTIGGEYVIRLKDVPNRTGILIHVGNYTHEIAGCIIVGKYQSATGTKKMVSSSRYTMHRLLETIGNEDIWVDII